MARYAPMLFLATLMVAAEALKTGQLPTDDLDPKVAAAVNEMTNAGSFWKKEEESENAELLAGQQHAIDKQDVKTGLESHSIESATNLAEATTATTKGKDVFLKRVSDLLTCRELEGKVTETCGSQPLYKGIYQFNNDEALCKKAMETVGELGQLFTEYLGQGATCQSQMDGWVFGGYASKEDCETKVRTSTFKNACKLML